MRAATQREIALTDADQRHAKVVLIIPGVPLFVGFFEAAQRLLKSAARALDCAQIKECVRGKSRVIAELVEREGLAKMCVRLFGISALQIDMAEVGMRSEERRVGKECR